MRCMLESERRGDEKGLKENERSESVDGAERAWMSGEANKKLLRTLFSVLLELILNDLN